MTKAILLRWRWRALIFFCLMVISAAFAIELAMPINLTAVDIGRHIANGQLILAGQWDVLYKNYYSFTYPQYPFINHHWLFGVLSYVLYERVGFVGIHAIYIAILILAMLLFVRAAFLRGHGEWAILAAFCVLPLLISRKEIRPEGISLLMMGLYYYVFTFLSLGRGKWAWSALGLALAQVFWVNTHIFFIMGPIMAAVFLWEGVARGCSVCVKRFLPLLVLLLAINIINPSGFAGMLTPLNIFQGFGYRLAENQHVWKMMEFFPKEVVYPYGLSISVFALILMVLAFRAQPKGFPWPFAALLLALVCAGMKVVRLFPYMAAFLIPLGAYFVQWSISRQTHAAQERWRVGVMMLNVALAMGLCFYALQQHPHLGLLPNINASAEFFKGNHLKGPIFSNYDIGGYLIFHLHEQEKVFVDNRQEAFPRQFFNDLYVPMQNNRSLWLEQDQKYGFNVIFFYRHDLTEWGQGFLIATLDDPAWVPVFVDDYTIIFVKRNAQNQEVIRQYQLPRQMFTVRKN